MTRKIFFILIAVFLFQGCQNLRGKFVRKKTQERETAVYVDFKDYPERPSPEAYRNYYLFIEGWFNELKDALDRDISWKREKRAINEAVMNLEQMMFFFNDEGQAAAEPFYSDVVALREEIGKFPRKSSFQRYRLIRRVEYLQRELGRNFRYRDIEQWLD